MSAKLRAISKVIGRVASIRRDASSSDRAHPSSSSPLAREPKWFPLPGAFTPMIPNELWGAIFRKLDVPELFACSQVSTLFRDIVAGTQVFKRTVESITYDDISDFPEYLPTTAADPLWAPLALGLHKREINWRTGHVSHITFLTGLPSNNIGRMTMRYPYFVASFTDDDSFRIWDMQTGKMRLLNMLDGLLIQLMDIVVENMTVVTTFSNHKSIKVYSLETGYIKDTYLSDSENGLITALRGEDQIIVAGYETGAICAWDRAGIMSYIPPLTGKAPAKIIALDIYRSYVMALTSAGKIQIHSTEDSDSSNSLVLLHAYTLPRMPPRSTVHFGAFSMASSGPISLIAAVSEPLTDEAPEGTIFNFHQDINYHIYHCIWSTTNNSDGPLRAPRIRAWDTQTPDHGVRWDAFVHASKGRCCVIETDTSTLQPRIKMLLPREKRVIKSLWSKDPRVLKVLQTIGVDGWVGQLGVDDDTMVVTGKWEVLYVLHFAPPSVDRIKQTLYETNTPVRDYNEADTY